MGDDWSREEVEATAADYFCMLDKELKGLKYNKTEHRRHLSGLLNVRSEGAIERKHQNISAILIKLGFPYIDGYKPLRNYQQILYDAVSSRLNKEKALVDFVQFQINQPATMPIINDILAALVDTPGADLIESQNSGTKVKELPSLQYKIDYLAQEARNRSLGQAGEKFVLQFERARLIRAGQERLASRVEHVSATQGDSAGFDVLSFDITGRERLIEVKTTTYGAFTPFFVTQNEVDLSHTAASEYYLYRTINFRKQPKLFTKHGPIDKSFNLYPQQYIASLA
ncbi:MAG: DUF3883 domain-containing protein [Dehalococcoidia bacterium]|nr:DUF3883 domain-containing protein [Dehalococcoidia bacterium]